MECAAKGRGASCMRGPPKRRCGLCSAVAYRSKSHQMLHWIDHKDEFSRLAQQMKHADGLSDFPFTFFNRNFKIRASMVSEGNCCCDFKGKENVEKNSHPIEKEMERTSEIDEEDEDEIPLSHLIKKSFADASHSSKEFFASQKPSEFGRNGGQRVSSGGEDVHTPLESAIKQQEESNIVSRSRKKLKLTDLSSSASARNPGSTGFNGVFHRGNQSYSKSTGNPRVYTGRTPTFEQRKLAEKRAQVLQRSLRSPSFIRSMALSHVFSGFWFNLPTKFCKENLPALDLKMILEDERGSEHAVNYLGSTRTAFSGGWRGFALAHTLELGDTLVF